MYSGKSLCKTVDLKSNLARTLALVFTLGLGTLCCTFKPSLVQAEVAIQRSKGSSGVYPLVKRQARGNLGRPANQILSVDTALQGGETAIHVDIVILVNDNGLITQERTKARVLVRHPLASPNTIVLGIATQSDEELNN